MQLFISINEPFPDDILFSICFRFRKIHDDKINGLSSSAKIARKRRNLVSMQFNMINWLVETVSLLLVMLKQRQILILNVPLPPGHLVRHAPGLLPGHRGKPAEGQGVFTVTDENTWKEERKLM